MKVIMLDVDGVLNANDDFGGKSKPNPRINGIRGISKTKILRLKHIVEETGAKIVLTSSWKYSYMNYLKHKFSGLEDMDEFGRYLEKKLASYHLHIFETTLAYDHMNGWHRGYEIREWLKNSPEPVESFVVLDDEVFVDYSENNIMPYLIKTDEATGLTDELAEKAIKYLNEGVDTAK